jgi:hypothetical protein
MSEIPVVLTPALGAVIGEVRRLEDDALVDELRLAEEQMRWASARRAAVIAVVQERIEAAGARVHGTADQIAVVLEISPRSADHLLDDAIAVVGRPLVWDAVHDAQIDMGKAVLIVAGLEGFDGLPRMDMEREAIGYAQTHTAYQLRKYLIQLTCDGDPGEIFRKQALDRRGVSIFPAGHGMADISARLSIEHAEVFFQRLTVLAKARGLPRPLRPGRGADPGSAPRGRAGRVPGQHHRAQRARGCDDPRGHPDR